MVSDVLMKLYESSIGFDTLPERFLRKRRTISYWLGFAILKYLVSWTCFIIFFTSEVLAVKI